MYRNKCENRGLVFSHRYLGLFLSYCLFKVSYCFDLSRFATFSVMSRKNEQFTSNYNSRVVIYEHKLFIRLDTGHTAQQLLMISFIFLLGSNYSIVLKPILLPPCRILETTSWTKKRRRTVWIDDWIICSIFGYLQQFKFTQKHQKLPILDRNLTKY